MTHTQRSIAVQEAPNYSDPDAFVSDLLLSAAFLPPEDETAQPDMSLAPELRAIWVSTAAPFADFLSALGMRQTDFARRFYIPLRTVQGWKLGERECPAYVRLMTAELIGFILD